MKSLLPLSYLVRSHQVFSLWYKLITTLVLCGIFPLSTWAQTKVWDKTLGGDKPDKLAITLATPDGGYLVGGSSASGQSGDKSQNNKGVPDRDDDLTYDYWLVKTNATGQKIWDKTFGGSGSDVLTALVPTADGGYLLAGSSGSDKSGDRSAKNRGVREGFYNQFTTDYWVIKIDAAGNKVWDQTYGGNKDDALATLITLPDGGFLLGGYSASGKSGEKSQPNKVEPMTAGYPSYDYWILKIDAKGKKVWDYTYGGQDNDFLTALLPTPEGGFLVGGFSYSDKSDDKSQPRRGVADYWVIRLNEQGKKVWDKTYGGVTEEASNIWCEENCSPEPIGASILTAMVATPDGGFLLGGHSNAEKGAEKSEYNLWSDYYGQDAGLHDYWVVKIDGAGHKLWDKIYGGVSSNLGYAGLDSYYTGDSKLSTIVPTPDGGYVLGGSSDSDQGRDKSEFSRRETEKDLERQRRYDYWLVKINAQGGKQWDKTIGGTRNDFLTTILPTGESSFILGGSSASDKSGDKAEANRNPNDPFGGPVIIWSAEEETDYWLVKLELDEKPALSSWNKRYGGSGADLFTTVISTQDGGYLSGGYTSSGVSGDKSQASRGGNDYWIVKSDENGKKQWEKRYGGSGEDYLNALIQTQDGGYLLGGSSLSGQGGDKSQESQGDRDYWIIKINSQGVKEWDKRFGGRGSDELKHVLQLAQGGYLLAGTSNSPWGGDKSQPNRGGDDYWVVGISSSGSKFWDKRFGGSQDDILEGFAPTLNGEFLLGGRSASGRSGDRTQDSRGGNDYWVVRFSEYGGKVWDKRYGGAGTDDLMVISNTGTSSDIFYLAGHSTSGISGDKTQGSRGGKDFWVLQINGKGDKIGDKRYGGNQDEGLRSFVVTRDGGYLLAGRSESGISGDKTQASRGGNDYWMVKADSKGEVQWDERYGGSGNDELRAAFQTQDGGYLLGGRSTSGSNGDRSQPSQGGSDYWLVKVGPKTSELIAARQATPAAAQENLAQKTGLMAYPNPVLEKTTICFSLPETQEAQVKVYDGQGREVAVLFQGEAKAKQSYEVPWQPAEKAAGLYILRLQTATQKQELKLLLTR